MSEKYYLMKNIHVERSKCAAKQFHRTKRNSHFDNRIQIRHAYDGLSPTRLTWWDDVTFIFSNYRVALAWHHPRMAYEEAIGAEVDRLSVDVPCESIMKKGMPTYKKLGHSRKKIVSIAYEMLDKSVWCNQMQRARQQVMQSAQYQIQPSLRSRWCQWSRIIFLCAPIEVRNADDVRKLVALTKQLLKREVTMQEVFPHYRYTRKDWEREGLQDDCADLHVHQSAGVKER